MERTLTLPPRMAGAHRARPKLESSIVAMVLVLMAETMLFAGLIGACVMMRGRAMVWPPVDLPRLAWWVTIATTSALLSSAVILASQGLAARRSSVLLTAFMGAVFFGVQAIEWTRMLKWNGARGVYAGVFFSLIGVHGLHVLAGVIALTWAGWTMGRPGDALRLKVCGMYWYFVVAVWPVLYVIIYH